MGLHMVHANQRDSPCYREAFGGANPGAETLEHSWATSDTNEVGFFPEYPFSV